MLRLKANVGIKWVYRKDKCPNFSSYICGCRSSEDQKKTLVEMRRKLRTDLPTSQSQVIAFVSDTNCILDLLQALSSVHRITMPACVGETGNSSNLRGRRGRGDRDPRRCWLLGPAVPQPVVFCSVEPASKAEQVGLHHHVEREERGAGGGAANISCWTYLPRR